AHRGPNLAAGEREIAASTRVKLRQHQAIPCRHREARQLSKGLLWPPRDRLRHVGWRRTVRISQAVETVLPNRRQHATRSRRGKHWAFQWSKHVVAIHSIHGVWLEARLHECKQL